MQKKAQTKKKKVDTLDFNKIRNFCSSRHYYNEKEKLERNYLQNISDKGHVFWIHEELLKLYDKYLKKMDKKHLIALSPKKADAQY